MLIDNQDGTITDTKTNLMWQQETTRPLTWDAAIKYCDKLKLSGYSDWRLPTIQELFSLIDFTKFNPCTDTAFFPDTESSDYWSSTTNASHTDYAWLVYFDDGDVYGLNKSFAYYVRAVRTIE